MDNSRIKSAWREKIFYGFGNMGSYVLWAFVATYVTIYVTECLQPGAANIQLIGTIILISRLFDAASDIAMGIVIEKTHSRLGKARFWLGISILPLVIVFFFLFFVSGLDKFAAIIVLSVLYFLFTVVFYTMNNIAFNAMLPRLSDDPFDQSNMCTIDSVFTSVGGLVTAIGVWALNALGGQQNQSSWTIFVLILAIFAAACEALCFFGLKEKPEIAEKNVIHQSKGETLRALKALFKTPYFYIAIAMFAINYYNSLSVTSVGKYYAVAVLHNEYAFSLFGSVPMVTMAIGLLLTPLLVKKISKRNTLILAIAFVVLGNIVGSAFPFSYAAGLSAVMIKGFGSAVVMSQLYTLAPDIVSYIEAKDGLRVEGLAASANSFGCKVGSGLGSAMVLWSISWCQYDASATAQSDGVIYTFITLYWWVPTLLSVILLILACFWNVTKKTAAFAKPKTVQIQAQESQKNPD
jgi:GPH family glycoside/pentoside/hexuronide:cation symporter